MVVCHLEPTKQRMLWINITCSNLLGHVQKLVQVHTSVGELPEGTLLFDLGIRLKEAYSMLAPQDKRAHTPLRVRGTTMSVNRIEHLL